MSDLGLDDGNIDGTVPTDGLDNVQAVDTTQEPPKDKIVDFGSDDSDLSDAALSDLDEEELLGLVEMDEADKEKTMLDQDALSKINIRKMKRAEGDAGATKGRVKSRRERQLREGRARPADSMDMDEMHIEPQRALTEDEKRIKDLDDRINAAVKQRTTRRKKDDSIDLEALNDDMVRALRNKMIDAAARDAEDKAAGLPAMHKLKMLDEVLRVFKQSALHPSIFEQNLLKAVTYWLEPLPDKSLPAYNIQRDLFNILTNLPITTNYLISSGLGKIVLFYTKDVRPQEHIKRQAEKLVYEWSRPILRKSNKYQDRKLMTANYTGPTKKKIPRQEAAVDGLAPPQLKSNRTRVPDNMPVSYDIVPVSQIASQDPRIARPLGASADDSIRRMRARLGGGVKKTKKGGLSIEGRGLH